MADDSIELPDVKKKREEEKKRGGVIGLPGAPSGAAGVRGISSAAASAASRGAAKTLVHAASGARGLLQTLLGRSLAAKAAALSQAP